MSVLYGADFSEADLSKADFGAANFSFVYLRGANLTKGSFASTVLADIDLSASIGLETTRHTFPSYIDTKTLQLSRGEIPEIFLRGCGLSDLDIEYSKLANPKLSNEEISSITQNIFDLKAIHPIQISPLFISYSHTNSFFVDKLETKLNEKGIRFWRDIHDAKAGRLETQIDRAIRHNPTVLLILSEHSTNSDWVEHEARLARKLEKELGRDVLCPIALDDSWKTCNWPERIKEQIMEYNILDFSNWKDDAELDMMFKKLIDGLDMFYKK
ncbi:MAG: toll/interleukin-1 receptor domain-containing protein [Chloroflexi bacterium]|nr:toll/interleukin-1 receptor domain-containing protein [Chloroflexota bacterium]